MKITKEKIEKLLELDEKLSEQREKVSDMLKDVKARNGENKITVNDEQEGGKRKIKEKDAWQEVYHLGNQAEPYDALKEKYPKLFEESDKESKFAKEYQSYVQEAFNTNYRKMKFSDLVRVVLGIVDYKNGEEDKK